MKTIFLTLLLMTSAANASIFDDASESVVRKLYKSISENDLAKMRTLTTEHGYEVFSNPQVLASIQNDIAAAGKMKYKSRLVSSWKDDGHEYRKYFVNASSKKNETNVPRILETLCRVERHFSCFMRPLETQEESSPDQTFRRGDDGIPEIPDFDLPKCRWQTTEYCDVNQ